MCIWLIRVAPFAGAWIEILKLLSSKQMNKSLPSRGRGLKYRRADSFKGYRTVAPFAGAWIEIESVQTDHSSDARSLPSRGRGLKLDELGMSGIRQGVAPFAGAWIEIEITEYENNAKLRRSLRGGVD